MNSYIKIKQLIYGQIFTVTYIVFNSLHIQQTWKCSISSLVHISCFSQMHIIQTIATLQLQNVVM